MSRFFWLVLIIALFMAHGYLYARAPYFSYHSDSLHYLSVATTLYNEVTEGNFRDFWRILLSQLQPNPPLVELYTAFLFILLKPATLHASRIIAIAGNLLFLFVMSFFLYLYARRIWNETTGFFAVTVCLSMPIVLWMSQEYLLEIPSAALLMVAVYAFEKSEWFRKRNFSLLFALAAGLGMLTKLHFALCLSGLVLYALTGLTLRLFTTLKARVAAFAAVGLLVPIIIGGVFRAGITRHIRDVSAVPHWFLLLSLLFGALFIVFHSINALLLKEDARDENGDETPRGWFDRRYKTNAFNFLDAVLLFAAACGPFYLVNADQLQRIASYTVADTRSILGVGGDFLSFLGAYIAIIGQMLYLPYTALLVMGIIIAVLVHKYRGKNVLPILIIVCSLCGIAYLTLKTSQPLVSFGIQLKQRFMPSERFLIPLVPFFAILMVFWTDSIGKWKIAALGLGALALAYVVSFDVTYSKYLPFRGDSAAAISEEIGRPAASSLFSFYARDRVKFNVTTVDGEIGRIFDFFKNEPKGEPIQILMCLDDTNPYISFGLLDGYIHFYRLPLRIFVIGHGMGRYPPLLPMQYGVFVVNLRQPSYVNEFLANIGREAAGSFDISWNYRVILYRFRTPITVKVPHFNDI